MVNDGRTDSVWAFVRIREHFEAAVFVRDQELAGVVTLARVLGVPLRHVHRVTGAPWWRIVREWLLPRGVEERRRSGVFSDGSLGDVNSVMGPVADPVSSGVVATVDVFAAQYRRAVQVAAACDWVQHSVAHRVREGLEDAGRVDRLPAHVGGLDPRRALAARDLPGWAVSWAWAMARGEGDLGLLDALRNDH